MAQKKVTIAERIAKPRKNTPASTASKKVLAQAKEGKNNKTRFSNKSNLKNAATTVLTVVGPGKFVKAASAASKTVKTAKATKAAGKARSVREASLEAGRARTIANKAKMDKLASTIKDYETRIARNKEGIKKLDLSPKGTTAIAQRNYRDMTQGIKDIEKSLKEAKIQYMGLKNPWK